MHELRKNFLELMLFPPFLWFDRESYMPRLIRPISPQTPEASPKLIKKHPSQSEKGLAALPVFHCTLRLTPPF